MNGGESVQLYRFRKALRMQREGEREKEVVSEGMQMEECMCDIADA